MHTVEFHCRTITPLFMYGADGSTPELRAPSIKGAMRFWWRAINSHLEIGKLREAESNIFGSSDELCGKSKFKIIVNSPSDFKNSLWSEIPFETRISRRGKRYKVPKSEYRGIAYLFYSVCMLSEKKYIPPGESFKVKIISNKEKDLKTAIETFFVLSFFGGLGSRSRRGGGNFDIESMSSESIDIDIESYDGIIKKLHQVENKEVLKEFIEQQVKGVLIKAPSISRETKYSSLLRAKILIFPKKDSWKKALNSVGTPFENFRHINVKRIKDTPNFGFPILHKRRNHKIVMVAGKKIGQDNYDFLTRRASPLIFKVIKTKKNSFLPVIIWLRGELVPKDYTIMDKTGGNRKNPSYEIVQEFWNTVQSQAQEVTI